jgi:hypothetical protein
MIDPCGVDQNKRVTTQQRSDDHVHDNANDGATIARSRLTAGKTMRSAIHADCYN